MKKLRNVSASSREGTTWRVWDTTRPQGPDRRSARHGLPCRAIWEAYAAGSTFPPASGAHLITNLVFLRRTFNRDDMEGMGHYAAAGPGSAFREARPPLAARATRLRTASDHTQQELEGAVTPGSAAGRVFPAIKLPSLGRHARDRVGFLARRDDMEGMGHYAAAGPGSAFREARPPLAARAVTGSTRSRPMG
jgi:hypothetical protein